jgi:hypothetical protein
VASWSIDGTAAVPLDNPLDAVGIVKRSFEGAMSEAAWMLTTGFREIAEVRDWLAAEGVR